MLDSEEVRPGAKRRRLRSQQTGIDLAHAAKSRASRRCSRPATLTRAAEVAVGCLAKPYSERQLLKAVECVDRHLQGEKVKPPRGFDCSNRAEAE